MQTVTSAENGGTERADFQVPRWGKGWVREHRPFITDGYGQSVLGLLISLKKIKG